MIAIRVVVADDDLLVRRGVVAVLGTLDGVEVVAEAGSLPELLEVTADVVPDVVVTDIRMPPTNTNEGIEATRIIRSEWPEIGVVVLSQYADSEHVLAAFEAGNSGVAYLLKENVAEIDTLRTAIVSVNSGGSAVDPAVVSVLVDSRRAQRAGIPGLTPREQEVLAHIAEGLNNSAIAERLVLSDRAVGKHINAIFSKLNLGEEPDSHRRVRAVLMWLSSLP